MRTSPHRVLLVEDNAGDVDLTRERIGEASKGACDLRVATHLSSAVAMMGSFRPDAIVLDLNLPDSRGVETLERIRGVAGDAAIIVVSGIIDESLRKVLLAHGAEEVFSKDEAGSRLFARSVLYVIERNIERNDARERHAQLERLVDAMPEAIVVVGHDRRVRYTNEAASRLFEKSHELLRVAPFDAGNDGDHRELRIERSDGPHACEMRTLPIAWGRESAQLVSIHDVTESRRSVELALENRRVLEADRSKTEFLTNMSHELRTPLNSIIGFTELLQLDQIPPGSPKHADYLDYVMTSSRHLLRLINDVLDLAKVEAGKLEFHSEERSAMHLIRLVIDGMRALASQKSITIDEHFDESIDAVFLDAGRFQQVLYNFMSNALKFTPRGGRITVSTSAQGSDMFRVAVRDSGAGIATEDIKRLFVRFQQLDGGTAREHEGTGVGLALTKRLVEFQGGSVGVETKLGEGSTFFAILPRRVMRQA